MGRISKHFSDQWDRVKCFIADGGRCIFSSQLCANQWVCSCAIQQAWCRYTSTWHPQEIWFGEEISLDFRRNQTLIQREEWKADNIWFLNFRTYRHRIHTWKQVCHRPFIPLATAFLPHWLLWHYFSLLG